MKRLRIIVDGRVQGVGFRYFVANGARQHHINGYVRNLPDGKVEIDAEGECENLHHFMDLCKRGPAQSRVETFASSDAPLFGYRDFIIRQRI